MILEATTVAKVEFNPMGFNLQTSTFFKLILSYENKETWKMKLEILTWFTSSLCNERNVI